MTARDSRSTKDVTSAQRLIGVGYVYATITPSICSQDILVLPWQVLQVRRSHVSPASPMCGETLIIHGRYIHSGDRIACTRAAQSSVVRRAECHRLHDRVSLWFSRASTHSDA